MIRLQIYQVLNGITTPISTSKVLAHVSNDGSMSWI